MGRCDGRIERCNGCAVGTMMVSAWVRSLGAMGALRCGMGPDGRCVGAMYECDGRVGSCNDGCGYVRMVGLWARCVGAMVR